MKKWTPLLILLLFFSCSTSKKTVKQKQETHVKLDRKKMGILFPNFSIEIPKTWFGYIESHDNLAISPKEFLVGTKDHKFHAVNNVYFAIREIPQKKCNCKTIDDFLQYEWEQLNQYQVTVDEKNHPIYGKYYNIQFLWNRFYGKITKENITLIKYKDKQFMLQYSSNEKSYSKYLDDVERMIRSFKINEETKK